MAKSKKKFSKRLQKTNAPKECYFCTEKKEPHFLDTQSLNRFLTERGKIIGRLKSGLCTKHQKRLTVEVKHARHLALLPFVVRV